MCRLLAEEEPVFELQLQAESEFQSKKRCNCLKKINKSGVHLNASRLR